jgi:hypothetical protein
MALTNDDKLRLARRAAALQPDFDKAESRGQLEKYLSLKPDELADQIARLEEALGGATGAAAIRLGHDAIPTEGED